MKAFAFAATDLDLQALRLQLADPTAGGYASFEGWVRNHNEGLAVHRLEYEAFAALAEKEGERIVQEAIDRFGVVKAACVHRVGSLAIGDLAVWVGVSSRHRAEAFAACRYIIDEVKHRVPIWKKEHYVNGDSGWVNCERCAAPSQHESHEHSHHSHDHHDHDHGHAHSGDHTHVTQPHVASPALAPDYSRQMTLRDVGESGQKKLAAARVLVIGAGGLGVPVLSYLAGAGIGTLGIVDGDTLDASNLHRQTLYALSDVGQGKVTLAAQRLRELNPAIKIVEHAERFASTNAERLLAGYDVVVECSDNFATKFLVNDAAVRARKPAVFASVYQYEGQLQVYRPDRDNACLRCLWPEATRDGLVGNCAEAGVLGPVPGVFGSLQALETLKLLLNLPGQLVGEMLLIDLLTHDQRKLRTARRADCAHDGSRTFAAESSDLEVSFGELRPALTAGFTVIDIREPQEVSEAPLPQPPSLAIPMGNLLKNDSELDPEQRYLLVCARGSRSRAAAEQLRERGFRQAFSLRGGAAALSRGL
jgi:adenylyltransferase/sulfurtransferase